MILLIFIVHHDISMDSLQLQAEMPALLALVIEAMKTHPSAPEAGWAGMVAKVWQV